MRMLFTWPFFTPVNRHWIGINRYVEDNQIFNFTMVFFRLQSSEPEELLPQQSVVILSHCDRETRSTTGIAVCRLWILLSRLS